VVFGYPQGQVTALKAKYLSLHGYRLPTEAEWEYACRAGAVTSRYYGETEELLPRYGWYVKNAGGRSRPVGSKKPNDLGLFDLHGNVYTWCQEIYQGDHPASKNGEGIEDKEGELSINSTVSRGVAWRLVPQSCVGRPLCLPCRTPADEPWQLCRLPSGEDCYALTALRLCPLPPKAVGNWK
jgi:formylglycine-generating enzyme required for sulfatase activity